MKYFVTPKGKMYPVFKHYDVSYNYETVEFKTKEDEYLWRVYYWLDVGVRYDYLTPNDTDDIISILDSYSNKSKDSYATFEKKLKEIKPMVKTFLEENY